MKESLSPDDVKSSDINPVNTAIESPSFIITSAVVDLIMSLSSGKKVLMAELMATHIKIRAHAPAMLSEEREPLCALLLQIFIDDLGADDCWEDILSPLVDPTKLLKPLRRPACTSTSGEQGALEDNTSTEMFSSIRPNQGIIKLKITSMILTMVILSTLTVASSFLLAANRKQITSDYFFISAAFNRDPARAVASFGLPLMAGSIAIICVCKYLWLTLHLERDKVVFANYALTFALIGSVALVGAGAVSISTHLWLHLSFAGVFFTFCLLTLLAFNLLYSFVSHQQPSLLIKAVRWILFVTGVLAWIVVLLFIYKIPSLASMSELVMVFSLVSYLVTFKHDLKHFRLQLALVAH